MTNKIATTMLTQAKEEYAIKTTEFNEATKSVANDIVTQVVLNETYEVSFDSLKKSIDSDIYQNTDSLIEKTIQSMLRGTQTLVYTYRSPKILSKNPFPDSNHHPYY